MKIGVNALFQANGGSLTNLIHLIENWREASVFEHHQFTFFASRHTYRHIRAVLPHHVHAEVLGAVDWGSPFRIGAEQVWLPRRVAAHRLDVLYCPANTMPYRTGVPCVVTLQNAAPFTSSVWELELTLRQRLRWMLLGRLMRRSVRRAARVIFGSQHFLELFAQSASLEREKATVIYRACERRNPETERSPALEAKYGIVAPYILMVSHLYPTKNVLELLEGFSQARSRGALGEIQLVLAGGQSIFPEYFQRIMTRVAELGLTDRDVVFTGSLDGQEIRSLVGGCHAFVFTSTCENCPHSLLEAMGMGKPIACSNVSVMPEIAGNTVEYFDPYRPQEIGAALERVCHDDALRRELGEKARIRARHFPDQAEVARQTLEVILSTVEEQVVRRRAA